MKKALQIVVAVACVAAVMVIGNRFIHPSGPRVLAPFNFDYKVDAGNVAFFAKSDDMSTLLKCTPFYAGAQPPGQNTQEFDDARARKVDEIIADSGKLAEAAIGLKSDVDQIRVALLDYLTVCSKNDPAAKTFANDAAKEALRLYTLEALTEAQYKSIAIDSTDPFTRSSMQYLRTAKAVQLGALYLQDVDSIAGFAAMGLEGLSATKNPKIAEANTKLDEAMGKLDDLKSNVTEVAAGMRKVDYGLRQLSTGDYYYARAAVGFMRDSMPQLKQAVKNAKPNQYTDARTVALAKDTLSKFDNFSEGFQKYLDAVPKSELIPVTALPVPSGAVFAEEKDKANDYGTAILAVNAPTKDSEQANEGWLAAGWSGIKKAVHGTQSVIGVGVDVAGCAVKNITRLGAGLYYGNTGKEIWRDIKKNSQQIITNWNNNKSGAETMYTANQYINAIDDAADYVASAGTEKVFGEGWTSWGVGKVSKAAVGIFTGLGKGITLVGNRDAQASDYVIGSLEIASSALGGSKLVIRGTQLPAFLKGLSKGSWISAQGAWNTLSKAALTLEKSETDALIKTAVKGGMQTVGFEARQASSQALLAAIEKTNQVLKAEMATIIQNGLKAGWANFTSTLSESFTEFTRKQFTNNLQGIASAMGGSAQGFIDNIMGQWGDDLVKSLVDKAMAESPIAEELAGVWTGTSTFTSIQIPPAASEKASKEGCDIAGAFKKLEGKPLGTTLRLNGAASGSGSGTLSIAFGKQASPFAVHYIYSAGSLLIDQAIKGGRVTVKAHAQRMTQGYALAGPITLSGGDKGVTIFMNGKTDVSRARTVVPGK